MTYDLEQLRGIIAERRARFKTVTVVCLILGALSVLLVILCDDITLRFIGAASFVITLCAFYAYLRRVQPSVLFRGELRGVNIKEHEFVPLGGQRRGIYRYTGTRRANPSSVHPRGIHAEVYLRDENGEIHPVLGLSKLHTDIYEDGDELYRPAGCVYPIIVERPVEKQPCPLCGRINTSKDKKCPICGLDVLA